MRWDVAVHFSFGGSRSQWQATASREFKAPALLGASWSLAMPVRCCEFVTARVVSYLVRSIEYNDIGYSLLKTVVSSKRHRLQGDDEMFDMNSTGSPDHFPSSFCR